MRSENNPLRYVFFLATFLVAMAAGGTLARNSQPLAAVPPQDECDHGECEHSHRWWWWDSHECVYNKNRVACGTDPTGEHGCETKECPPEGT